MARASTGRILFGLFLSLVGAALIALAWGRPELWPFPPSYVMGAGGGLFLLGFATMVTGRKKPQPEASIPAHIAFSSKMDGELAPPPRVARPAQARAEITDPHLIALQSIDEEIRDLTRRINKAAVMLATGKLSGDAYTKYVDELKRQRGALEADRVHIEIRKRAA